ncbi:MAG: hypothetical protein GEV11_21580 [Streptosporangiales bacterium]|nr:hypothetical protein [Streptosporangiales bacterium]
MAVTRDQIGYRVCLGAPAGYDAYVVDSSPDGWGAVLYAQYDVWAGSRGWQHVHRHHIARADGHTETTDFERSFGAVRNFHVVVCRIRSGEPYNFCGDPG